MGKKDGRGDCVACGAKCCRYITVEIEKPRKKVDVDEIRWFLAHENIEVFIDEGQWYLQVYNRCKHLTRNNRCRIYDRRFDVCRDYDTATCEASDGEDDAISFRTTEEFDEYRARKKAKRKAKKKRKKERKKERGMGKKDGKGGEKRKRRQ